MRIIRINFTYLIILFLGVNSWAQIGVSDRINQENDRGPSLAAIETAALKESARGNNYGAMRYYAIIMAAEPLNVMALKGYGDKFVYGVSELVIGRKQAMLRDFVLLLLLLCTRCIRTFN